MNKLITFAYISAVIIIILVCIYICDHKNKSISTFISYPYALMYKMRPSAIEFNPASPYGAQSNFLMNQLGL